MTLLGFRRFVTEQAETRVYAFLSAYQVAASKDISIPTYSPAGVDTDATVAAANANKDIVRGIKGHAEIGGFAGGSMRVIEMAARSAAGPGCRSTFIFGALWSLSGAAPMARTRTRFSNASFRS
jgi:dihydroorotase